MKIEILKEDSEYLYTFIQKIIEDCGPRMPCSPQELKASNIIKKELEKTCDDVLSEEFTCHPRAFIGYIRIVILLDIISIFLFFIPFFFKTNSWFLIIAIISFVLSFLSFIVIWYEFFNYQEFIDKLFKKKSSQNVIGRIKSKEEVKNIIVFSAHSDSALQFNLLKHLKFFYFVSIFIGILFIFSWIVITGLFLILILVKLVNFQLFFNITVWLVIIISPVIIALWFFVSGGEKANKVPGAVDNLSAVAVVLGIGRYLKVHKDIIPKNTEIRLISFGCEEAGLRGAYRYVKAHFDELSKYNAVDINMDIIQSVKNFGIIAYEPTTRTKHSMEVVQKLVDAAESIDIKAKILGVSFRDKLIGQILGGTDATPFSKSSIKAANISSLDFKKYFKFYHQPTDTLEMIEKGALENALKVCLAYLMDFSSNN